MKLLTGASIAALCLWPISALAQPENVIVTATYPYTISLMGLVIQSGRLSSKTTERVE